MAPILAKSLGRLSRDSLIDLCWKWTQPQHSLPYTQTNRNVVESEEEDYLHDPAENAQALRELYSKLRQSASTSTKETLSKRDIIDRIVDGDWRRGLSLHQLAMIDFAYLEQNDTALRWSALKLVPLATTDSEDKVSHPAKKRKILCPPPTMHYPEVTPSAFVANLKAEISPLVKAHYYLHRLPSPANLTILRLYIVPNTPFAPKKSSIPRDPKMATDSARIMYIALPDSCPYVYISLSGSTGGIQPMAGNSKMSAAKVDIAATKRIILESIPKALSRPHERWSLESTKLTTKSLHSICTLRGNGKAGTSGGAYSKFSEERVLLHSTKDSRSTKDTRSAETNLLDISLPLQLKQHAQQPTNLETEVETRFGSMCGPSHAALDRFHVKIENILPPSPLESNNSSSSGISSNNKRKRKRRSLEDIEQNRQESNNESEKPPATISLTFCGSDVFAGLKKLALLGPEYVDLSKAPAWLTGEKGVSGMVV